MIKVYPYDELGHVNHGWLDARHHFNFASYHNPKRMGFGALKVINDDTVQPHKGFAPHGHQDMEIITYVRQGAISHRDDVGNEGKTRAGDVQVMSAGRGIHHSEFNHEEVETRLYQIWIEPRERGVAPSWACHEFPKESIAGQLHLLVSGDGTAPLQINQDAKIFAAQLKTGQTIHHELAKNAYVLVAAGCIELDNQSMSQGDGAEITNHRSLQIKALSNAEILLIEV